MNNLKDIEKWLREKEIYALKIKKKKNNHLCTQNIIELVNNMSGNKWLNDL